MPPRKAKVHNNRRNAQRQLTSSRGGSSRRPKRNTKVRGGVANYAAMASKAFNAFHPSHLPLPSPTGAYMPVTTRTTINSSDTVFLIGATSFQHTFNDNPAQGTGPAWSPAVALSATEVMGIGNSPVDWYNTPLPSTDSAGGTELVPAAISFKVTNTQSMLDASGLVYIGRYKSTLSAPHSEDPRTFGTLMSSALSFCNPKQISAAGLAMNTQHVNLLPSNMTELMDFRELDATHPQPTYSYAWGHDNDVNAGANRAIRNFAGFKPGFIYNPNACPLSITIAVEWRVRVAPYNPMHMSMSSFPPSHPGGYHKLLKAAEGAETGVEDAGLLGAGAAAATAAGAEGGIMGTLGSFMGSAAAALPEIAEFAPLLLL